MSIVHPLPETQLLPCISSQAVYLSFKNGNVLNILEKLTDPQIIKYMALENVLPKLQSGFRRNQSTCIALFMLGELV